VQEYHYEEKCGLVFCMSTSDTDLLSEWLNAQGMSTASYHGKMDIERRNEVQRQWTNNEVRCIVATLAFGMGIDKPDVRFVVHHTIPKSVEAYYQQSGRAGRDGMQSHCLALYSRADKARVQHLFSFDQDTGKAKEGPRFQIELQLLEAMAAYCIDKTSCRRAILLGYFGEAFDSANCRETCDNCVRRASGTTNSKAVDATDAAADLVRIVREIYARRPDGPPYPTEGHIISVYVGENLAKLRTCGDTDIDEFGKGSRHKGRKDLLHQIFPVLVDRGVLTAKTRLGLYGSIPYLVPGPASGARLDPVTLYDCVDKVPDGLSEADMPLWNDLMKLRRALAADERCSEVQIIPTALVQAIAQHKPRTAAEMASLVELPPGKAEKYGRAFVDAVTRYEAAEQARRAELHLPPTPKGRKPKQSPAAAERAAPRPAPVAALSQPAPAEPAKSIPADMLAFFKGLGAVFNSQSG
jgi:bloom syndrome protein